MWARLQVAANVVEGHAGFFEHTGGGWGIRIKHRQKEVDRVDLIVAHDLSLTVGVDEQLAQRDRGQCAVGGQPRRDRVHIDAELADRLTGEAAPQLQCCPKDVGGCGLRFTARSGIRGRVLQDLARVVSQRDIRGSTLQLGGDVRHDGPV